MRTLVAIPVFNEERYAEDVIRRVLEIHPDVLAVDDGSTDQTPEILGSLPIEVVRHPQNRGYGASLQDAFRHASIGGYDWLITMDCDEQHEPDAIPRFLAAAAEDDLDVVSGSRYLSDMDGVGVPPQDRRAINVRITAELNDRLGLALTDAFCGYKAYRVEPLDRLTLSENGYAFPMQFWVQAVAAGLRIGEIPVRRIYTDAARSFGGQLDDPDVRLAHYRKVLHCELERCARRLPAHALTDVAAGCR